MPICLLIRHGENEFVRQGRLAGRLPGVHLNQHGRDQSQSVADLLAGKENPGDLQQPIGTHLGDGTTPGPGIRVTRDRSPGVGRIGFWRMAGSKT